MLLDRKKYSEFGYIEEELFSNSKEDRLHKCVVAEQTITDGDFSLDEALEAYQITKEEYENYVAKKSVASIFISLSGNMTGYPVNEIIFTMPSYFEVFAKMLESSADLQKSKIFQTRIGKITKELHGISKAIRESKEKA